MWTPTKSIMSAKGSRRSFILNVQSWRRGVWCFGCSKQPDGSDLSDLSDHRCWFEVEQSSALCKWAAAMSKQQDVIVFLQQEKFLANISSFSSSAVEEKLIIVVSGSLELHDDLLFHLPWHRHPEDGLEIVGISSKWLWCKSIQPNASHVLVKLGESISMHIAFKNVYSSYN